MNPDDTNEKDSTSRFERLPPGAEQANGQKSLRATLDVTRGVHRANPTISPAVQPGSREIWRLSEETKLLEAEALFEWAVGSDLMLDADDFTRRWFAGGCIEGGENQVFSTDGIVYKRNNLAFHTSYFEYFERLIVHDWLFPDTLYVLEGFMWVQENDDEFHQLRPVVSQKALRGIRGATREEVEAEMNRMGFVRRYEDNYHSPSLNLFVEDLHDQNVLVDSSGDLLIFDPVIYLTGSVSSNQ